MLIGGGSIGAAMIAGLRGAKYEGPLAVHDRSAETMTLLRRKYRVTAEKELARAVRNASVVVLAVRPDAAADLLHELNAALSQKGAGPQRIFVSVMAGLPLAWLRARIFAPVNWVRAMPSPLCESRNGLTALTFGRGCSRQARQRAKQLFGAFGQVIEIPERQFDAFTVLYSPSHGLHALSALVEAGCQTGFNRKAALLAARHALSAAGAVQDVGQLRRMVRQAATPGGTAEATMAGMDNAGYRAAVVAGVKAGIQRARSMAQERR